MPMRMARRAWGRAAGASSSILHMRTLPLLLLLGACAGPAPGEGPIDPFLGEPALEVQSVFEGGRFPSIVVTTAGTVLATWGGSTVVARRSEDGGASGGVKLRSPGVAGECDVERGAAGTNGRLGHRQQRAAQRERLAQLLVRQRSVFEG